MGFKDLLRGSITSSVAKSFKDLFDRADQTGLGGAWTSIRSGFNVSGNKAVGTTSNYPISVVTAASQDVDINLRGISEGAGAALWVTDSGNWFAIGVNQEPVDCNCVTQNVFVQGNTDYANQFVPGNFAWANQFVPGNFAWANQFVQGNTGNQNVYVAGNNYNVAVTNFDGFYTCNANNTSTCKTSGTQCNAYNPTACNAYATTFCAYSYYSNVNKKTVCGVYGGGACRTWGGGGCKTWSNVCNAYNTTNCKTSTADYWTYWYIASNAYTYSYYYDNSYTTQYQYNNQYTYQYQYNNQYTYQYSFNNSYTYSQTVCQTCYPQYIRVIQSVGSTISTLTSWTIASLVKALRVKTSGTQITVSAFSDDSGVSQIGSDLVYTATGATINPKYGIVVTPSTYNQGYSIDSINIDKN
jgi:hypothetical protein